MTFLPVREHAATLWEVTGVDSAGDPAVGTPVAITVRWEQRQSVFRGSDGSELRATHVVYLAQDVDVGDFLFLGTSTVADPGTVDGALRVQDFRRIEFFGGNDVERRALL